VFTKLLLFSGIAGIADFFGGLLVNFFNHDIKEGALKYEITYALMSFGSGIMLSALALVLIPKGMEELKLLPLAISFIVGAILFMYLDEYLKKKGGKRLTY
jgi:ZIP family zinc transporter